MNESNTPPVRFYFDFGSPNAYLSHLVIPGIEQRTGAKFEYVPVLLGGIFKATSNAAPSVTYGGVRNKLEYQQLETERFVKRHGITAYRFNPDFPINTLFLMRGAIYAQSQGPDVFTRYVEEMYRHMWAEPKKMDDPETVGAALAESGLDAAAFLDGTQSHEVKQQLIANTERAVETGVFGSPSFTVGCELFFGKNTLGEIEAEIVAQA